MTCTAQLINPATNKAIKTLYINDTYRASSERVDKLNEDLNRKGNTKELFWIITQINN